MKIWELEQKKGPYQIKEKKVIKKEKKTSTICISITKLFLGKFIINENVILFLLQHFINSCRFCVHITV